MNNGNGGILSLSGGLETYVEVGNTLAVQWAHFLSRSCIQISTTHPLHPPTCRPCKVYAAVAAAIGRSVVPMAGFGPSNMAGISVDDGNTADNCTVCAFLFKFGDTIRERALKIDFAAISEYSRWDTHGNGPAKLMQSGVLGIAEFSRRATDRKLPLEIHEFGWAGWGQWRDKVPWASGAFGGAWSAAAWLWSRQVGVVKVCPVFLGRACHRLCHSPLPGNVLAHPTLWLPRAHASPLVDLTCELTLRLHFTSVCRRFTGGTRWTTASPETTVTHLGVTLAIRLDILLSPRGGTSSLQHCA
jgi:hypothetical protein